MAKGEVQRRIDRLARKAQRLDDIIQQTAALQKQIVEEIRQIGLRDNADRPPRSLEPTPTPRPVRRAKKRR
jgi:hypothetical protein